MISKIVGTLVTLATKQPNPLGDAVLPTRMDSMHAHASRLVTDVPVLICWTNRIVQVRPTRGTLPTWETCRNRNSSSSLLVLFPRGRIDMKLPSEIFFLRNIENLLVRGNFRDSLSPISGFRAASARAGNLSYSFLSSLGSTCDREKSTSLND